MPSILAHDFIDNTKSDRGALKQRGSLGKVLCHPLLSSVIHTNGLFLRYLSRIGRPSNVRQVTGFEKFAFSLG